jgi:hypothetical protein
VGFSSEYKDKSSEIGKWLTRFFGQEQWQRLFGIASGLAEKSNLTYY